MMRWLALLLLVSCAPDRINTGVSYVDSGASFIGTTSRPSNYGSSTSFDFDQDPYFVYSVGAEWDIGGKVAAPNLDYLSGYLHRHRAGSENNQTNGEHADHSWWQEQVESVLQWDADKLMILALVIFMFRKDIVRLLPGWLKPKEAADEENTASE